MEGIKKLFTDFWTNTKEYFKINFVAILLIAAVIITTIVVFLPKQKSVDQRLSEKTNEIAELYNAKTGQWTNPALAYKLQTEVTSIENDEGFILNLFQYLILFVVLVVTVPIGAWVMQWFYTDIKFTKQIYTGTDMQYTDNERRSKLIVLAAIFISATIAACVSMVLAFYN